MTPVNASVTAERRIKGLVGIRDSVRQLIEYQTADYPDEMIEAQQAQPNTMPTSSLNCFARGRRMCGQRLLESILKETAPAIYRQASPLS